MRRHSLVAIILTSGVAIALVSLAIAAAIAEASQDRSISETAATLLSTSLGAAIGAVATYLGSHPREPRSADPLELDEPGNAVPDAD